MERILPSELTLEILSRLPTKSVLQCREVCTGWRDLIGHPSNAHMRLQPLSQFNGNSFSSLSSHTVADVGIGLLFSFLFPPENGYQFYYGEYQNQHNYKLKRITQPPIVSRSVVGSCNSLICFSVANRFGVHEPSYICNPVTGEYVNFPRLNVKGESEFDAMVCGFGYHPSTNKYKIVKLCYVRNQPLGQVKVYTLGSGTGWRDMGETTCSLRPTGETFRGIINHRSPFGTLANGALHWINEENKIVSFDLANENVYLLPSPPFDRPILMGDCLKLVSPGGRLCFVHSTQAGIDMWFLKKKGESISSDMNEQDDYDSLNWIKDFSIPIGPEAEPCALTNGGVVPMVLCEISKHEQEKMNMKKWSFYSEF
ncbi:F-box protein At3g07870-like [Papaver somniferum]|uniref:F-box protein At3g07870-like n=1 Tax=Papaver somniferum TaxID=3469 RepID=UPI000E6F4831|nr:F-box protein At3g07870-like [Papaver somniferum]